MSIETVHRRSTTGQPYPYQRVELVEPDWTRFPGWKDVTAEEWASVQWQRAHCVKNVKQLRELMGDLVDERFYADLERDQAERATMSMLVPPQMMNTMAPHVEPAGPGLADRGVLRRPGPPLHDPGLLATAAPTGPRTRTPPATRCTSTTCGSTEGLTHRYPTKVLAELLPTCPQYCGHCTRMDLVGNSTPVIEKLKFAGKPNDRLGDMLDYLRRTPSVRDVVVSGGDVANMPWPRLEAFLTEAARDREHPRHPARHQGADRPPAALAAARRRRGRRAGSPRSPARAASRSRSTPTSTTRNSVTPLVAEATRAMLDAGVRDVRNQGVLLNGVNADPHALLDLCFRLLDGAQIMPYYFYMCDMIPFSEHWRVSVADAQRLQHHIMGYLPGLRDAAHRVRRAVRRQALGAPARRLRHRARHLLLDEELPHLHRGRPTAEALSRTYEYYDPIHTLPAAGQAVVGASTAASTSPRSRPPRWPRPRAVRPPSRPTEVLALVVRSPRSGGDSCTGRPLQRPTSAQDFATGPHRRPERAASCRPQASRRGLRPQGRLRRCARRVRACGQGRLHGAAARPSRSGRTTSGSGASSSPAGWSDRDIARAVAAACIHRVRYGAYVDRRRWATARLRPGPAPSARTSGAQDRAPGQRPDPSVGHGGAHRLAVAPLTWTTSHLTRTDGVAGRHEAGIVHHSRRPCT